MPLAIAPQPRVKQKLSVHLISGCWDASPQRTSGDGFTVWTLSNANALMSIHCATMLQAVKTKLKLIV